MIADLHCHSTSSDGELTPLALYALACDAGVELLALTDHDTVDGVLALQAGGCGEATDACRLVTGVELSTLWSKRSVHIVGLNLDIHSPALRQALAGQRDLRYERAMRIGDKLAAQGIQGAYAGALEFAGDSAPCRPHFASWLVQQGVCKDGQQAFVRYLGNNKMPGINHQWPALEEAVGWITAAGGIAVLAHPEDYRLTRTKLRALLADFVSAGGGAVEMAAPGRTLDVARLTEQLCREFKLAASVGSDYHGAGNGWRQLGKTRVIPPDIAPVWSLFQGY
jgi:hypothetical protein